MKKKLKKAMMLVLMLCIIGSSVPVNEVYAASTAQAKVSETITPGSIWEDEVVDVTITLESIPYEGKVQPNDVILVLDCSGSMNTDNNISQLKVAAKKFVDRIDLNTHRIGVVAYGSNTQTLALTTDKDALKSFITNASDGGGTETDDAIYEAVNLLAAKRGNAVGSIVLMTDGQASEQEAAVAAAEMAKSKKYVFYTVALCQDLNSIENINLKKMATSEADHYSVFSASKLERAYSSICSKIGKVYAEDVVVTQTIADPFELVAGSTDSNVPQPTINGNTLTWKMNQLGQGYTYLMFQLKVKEGATAGIYRPLSGTMTYRDYNNGMVDLTISSPEVNLKVHAPKIISVTPAYCINGNADEVTLTVDYLQSGAKVYVNDKEVSNATYSSDTIIFNMPDCAPGNAIIKVVNPDGQSSMVNMLIEGRAEITSITPDVGQPKKRTEITIVGVDILTATDTKKTVKVLIDGKSALITNVNPTTQTIVCKTPSLAEGTYDVEVINGAGQSVVKSAGFRYEPIIPVVINPTITSITPAIGAIKTRCPLVIEGSDFDTVNFPTVILKAQSTGTVYKVTIDEDNSTATHIECKTSSLPLDTFDVTITNPDGGTVTMTGGFQTSDNVNRQNPIIDNIAPNVVPPKTRTEVIITGSDFVGTTKTLKVYIDGKSALVTSVSDTQIVIKTPSLAVGGYDLQIVNSTGANTTISSAIEYRNP